MAKYIYFTLVVILMAVMDGINFVLPHNDGFWSLTYGADRIWPDAWHLCKLGILFILYIDGTEFKNRTWIIKAAAFMFIAVAGQLIFYTYLFKGV